jgi:hypothetical protein
LHNIISADESKYVKVARHDDTTADIVGVVIAKALLKIGSPVYDRVSRMLQGRYATFADCYRNPELLSTILKEIYGDGYKSVVAEIKKESRWYKEHHQVVQFIKSLN